MKTFLENKLKEEICKWNKDDIYVVSLFVYDQCDDPLKPTVQLGYNTISNYKEKIAKASSNNEAKWNFAFWLQNCEYVFGQYNSESIVQNWIEEKKLTENNVTKEFVSVLVKIVEELHQTGFIVEQFGKSIPVIIHELEYYEEISIQNYLANPTDVIREFMDFCR